MTVLCPAPGIVRVTMIAALALLRTASAQVVEPGQGFQRFRLDNGLEILVVEDHAAPIAVVLVAVRAGADAQEREDAGVAHLFEHLVFRAGGGDEATASLGGGNQATTGIESVEYFLMLPSQNAVRGIQLLGRLITRFTLSADDFESERLVVLDELERDQSDLESTLQRQVSQRLWGTAWHRRDVGGDSLSLMGITPDRLRAAYARYYVPNNAALIVSGDVLAADVLAAAERSFGAWRRGPDPFAGGHAEPIVSLVGSRAVLVGHGVPDVTVRIAMLGPGVAEDSAATYAADALFELINDPRSTFQQHLVGSGLFQWLYGSYVPLQDAGPITFVGKTTDSTALDALRALVAEIDSLEALPGVVEDDLAVAKRRRTVDGVLAREGAALLAPYLASAWAGAGLDYYATYHQHMDAQTLDDVRQFARRYLVGRPHVVGVLGPDTATEPIAAWIRGFLHGP